VTGPARTIAIEELDQAALAGCGTVLGLGPPTDGAVPAFMGATADFWHASDFDPGADGTPELLWVRYRDDSLVVRSLEAHWYTEQAVVPLGAAIVQVVCPTRGDGSQLPDLEGLRAFRVAAGRGICMHRGTWHTSFAPAGEAVCLMLTRASTTRDLAAHLVTGAPVSETTIIDLATLGGPRRLL
jgi:ureidoglycolate lyase